MRTIEQFQIADLPEGFKSIGFYVYPSDFLPQSAERITLLREGYECLYNTSEVVESDLGEDGKCIPTGHSPEWVENPKEKEQVIAVTFGKHFELLKGYTVYFIAVQPHNEDGIYTVYGCTSNEDEIWYSPTLNKTLLV